MKTAKKHIHGTLVQLRHLAYTRAPVDVITAYFTQPRNNEALTTTYQSKIDAFASTKRGLHLSTDWFSRNVPYWYQLIDDHDLRRPGIQALEIGCWEGLSSYFILSEMPHAHLTCVDTWEGADEHKDGTASPADTLLRIEQAFDANLSVFTSRLKKVKGTSQSYFSAHHASTRFDFIYVDGSHHAEDVFTDAVESFARLKVGGILVFDDYFWTYYRAWSDNPAAGINRFLRSHQGLYDVIQLHEQLTIVKTSERQQPPPPTQDA